MGFEAADRRIEAILFPIRNAGVTQPAALTARDRYVLLQDAPGDDRGRDRDVRQRRPSADPADGDRRRRPSEHDVELRRRDDR